MMKGFLTFLILGLVSCGTSATDNTEFQNSELVSVTKVKQESNEGIRTMIVFKDIENKQIDHSFTPPLKFNSAEEISEIVIKEYVQRREVDRKGNNEIINLQFNVFKAISIQELNFIAKKSEELVKQKNNTFSGDLFIYFYYSSKGDEWLKVPMLAPQDVLKK